MIGVVLISSLVAFMATSLGFYFFSRNTKSKDKEKISSLEQTISDFLESGDSSQIFVFSSLYHD